ncbi:hypothetical protein C8F01DRAFT_1134674 [Mycena amicta]|nr:hypothetical protein C8F01DRAFT_1134674 [Mycena amicta]
MHPSLQPAKTRFLPGTIKLHASALCAGNGGLDDWSQMANFLSNAPDEVAQYVLPVLYAVLEIAPISDQPLDFQSLPPVRVELALQALSAIAHQPNLDFARSAGRDLWPRAWRWLDLISIFTGSLPAGILFTKTEIDVIGVLVLQKFARDPELFQLIQTNPRALFVCARGWGLVHPFTLTFIAELFSAETIAAAPERVAAIIDGADGYETLAQHLQQTFQSALEDLKFLNQNKNASAVLHCGNLIRVLHNLDATLCLTRDTALKAQPPQHLGDLPTALLSNGILKQLSTLCDALVAFFIPGAYQVAYETFCLLVPLLCTPPGHLYAEEAAPYLVQSLITLVRRLAERPNRREDQTERHAEEVVKFYFTTLLPPYLMRFGFLRAIHDGSRNGTAIESTASEREFKDWRFYDEVWMPFKKLLRDRLDAYHWYISDRRQALRMCDNIECGRVGPRNKFQKCTGCLVFCYCSENCQKDDWRSGRHRTQCHAYHWFNLYELDLGLTKRERSFLRALVDWDWNEGGKQHLKLLTLPSKIPVQSVPGVDLSQSFPVARYDYSQGTVDHNWLHFPKVEIAQRIPWIIFDSVAIRIGAVWPDLVQRAVASEGRLSITAVRFASGVDGHGGRDEWLITLHRANKSTLPTVQRLRDAYLAHGMDKNYGVKALEIMHEEAVVEFHL